MNYFYDDEDIDDDDPNVPDEEEQNEEEQSGSKRSTQDTLEDLKKARDKIEQHQQKGNGSNSSNNPDISSQGQTGGSGTSAPKGGSSPSGGASGGAPSGGMPGGASGSGMTGGAQAASTTGSTAATSGASGAAAGTGGAAAGTGAAAGGGAAAAGTGAAAGGAAASGAAAGAGAGAAATAGVAAGAAVAWPVLLVILIIVIIIVLIICFIGVALFFQTMPGAVMEKLKGMARGVGNAFASFFGADSTKLDVKQESIYEVLDYLEEMGYDLKGYGFLTEFVGDDGPDADAEDDGVLRDEDGLISKASSTYIMQYLISDNYLYTIKNFNVDTGTGESDSNWFFNIFIEAGNVLQAIWEQASSLWSNDLANRTGMLAIYKDTGTIGSRGILYKRSEMGYIKTDASSQELIIKKGWFNNPMKYSLDGWTGRYGMPLEFLLSIHVATMMPDLAYDMVDNFKTEVNILLHETKNGEVAGAYKTESGKYVEYPTVSEAINGTSGEGFIGWIKSHVDEWGLNKDEAQALLDLGIVPPMHNPPECGCTLSGEEKVLYYNDKFVYEDDDGYYYESYEPTESGGMEAIKVYLTAEETPEEKTVNGVIKSIGDDCKTYWKAAVGYMHSETDYDYNTYVPYIESVTDHWYRDVYFVADENQELVDYDYDYEAIMRERWTLYETYGTDNPEKMGEYKLYPLKKNGEYAKNLNEVYVEDESKKSEAQAKIDSSTMLFDGTYEEATALTIHVAKKATTIKIGDEYEDLNWEKVEGTNKYSAYSSKVDETPDYQKLYHEGMDKYDKASDIKKKAMDHIYGVIKIGNITQQGEGQRTETNSKIKKMFLENRYFRFDGDKLKAEAIVALRNKYNLKFGPLQKDANTPYTEEELEKMEITVTKDGDVLNGTSGTVSNAATYNAKQLSGTVSINQESLDAFTMLENTHTLDADYIYRDFKELIVELGYFEKEELTDETPRVMEFPVPETGSAGYPNRSIDKIEAEPGTMIHSKGDIDARGAQSLNALVEEFLKANPEVDPDIDPSETTQSKNSSLSMNSHILEGASSQLGVSASEALEHDKGEGNKEADSSSTSSVSVDEFLEKAREICEYMDSVGYDYCVINGKDCTHKGYASCGSLSATFEDSKSNRNVCCATLVSWILKECEVDMSGCINPNSCSYLVPYMVNQLEGEVIENYSELEPGDILCYIHNESDGEGFQHVDILGEEEGSGFVKYNGGHYVDSSNSSIGSFDESAFNSEDLCFGVRLFGSKKSKAEPYVGYNGNEAVVSPVTGILLDYGTYDPNEETGKDIDNIANEPERVNVDLRYGNLLTKGMGEDEATEEVTTNPDSEETTIQSDKVGYAKILVLNADYYKALESMTNNRWKNSGVSLVNTKQQESEEGKTIKSYYSDYQGSDLILKEKKQLNDDNLDGNDSDAWSEIDKLVYGYKEFAETYEYAGIGGYVVYIDGFVCEEPDEEFTEEDIEDKVPYQDNSSARNDAKISLDRYKEITESVVSSDSDDSNEKLMASLYESPEDYKMASQKATDKLNAELAVKEAAASSIFIPNVKIDDETKDVIFIKEGTILGRTMTDRELITEIREQDEEKLKEYRPSFYEEETTTGGSSDDEDDGPKDKVMGNYIRVIMKDLVDTTVENVEDYMKLDEGNFSQELDDEKFLFWMGCYCEGGNLENRGGKWYSVPVDLGDGAGATHFYGLTHYNMDLAKKLGYNVSNWGDDLPLDMLTDVYVNLIEEQKAEIKEELGEDIDDGYLQAFISILHNYGNLTKRGTEYKSNGKVSESTWCTYEGTKYAEALTKRRVAEWKLITEGLYMNYNDGNTGEIDWKYPYGSGTQYSEETPFTDFITDHGVTGVEIKDT